jgi:hypothetical protein
MLGSLGFGPDSLYTLLQKKAAKTPDLDPVALGQAIGRFTKKQLNDLIGFASGEAGLLR